MRFAALLLLLSGLGFTQTFSAGPTNPESEKVSVHLTYSSDPDFIEEQCFWHFYEQGKGKNQPVTLEGCRAVDFSLGKGVHLVELVVNGREKKYPHLSIEQRHIVKSVTIASRITEGTPKPPE